MKSIKKEEDVFVVLHDIRSIHNVGSIFRTANCLGVSNIILVGYTPTPIDRFGRPRKDFSKVSLGAEISLSWRHFKTISQALAFLKEQRALIVGVEQSPASIDYRKIKIRCPVAFILGNEVGGIPANVLVQCDFVAEIPMRGKLARNRLVDGGGKKSLNVSVVAGIVLAQYLKISK